MRIKKFIIIIILVVTLVIFANIVIKNENIVYNPEKLLKNDNITEVVENTTQGFILNATKLKSDTTNSEDIEKNSKYLQCLINQVSEKGGGTVIIPAGTFYFAPIGQVEENGPLEYIIKCKNNVMVEGKGINEKTGTVLKPYAPDNEISVTMFFYNENLEAYLKNADFKNFVIDSENANLEDTTKYYAGRGKGFMITLYENCDWYNVVVKNTDATGFGMDFPINSTIKNCKAINCGKAATETNNGASGFGIRNGLF